MNNQRNSGYIFNNTENNSNYNILNKSNQNETKYSSNNSYIKNGGPSSLNKTPNFYRKIDNIYEQNYTHKHVNTNIKTDLIKNSKIPTDKNYRNTVSNKTGNIQKRRKIQTNNYNYSYNYNLNNNSSINYANNNKNSLDKSRKMRITSERSHNKDYKYRKMINTNLDNNNNTISLNDLIINKQKIIKGMKDVNNKSIDLQVYDFMKKNDEKEYRTKYQNSSSKININKSMDSKRLLYKGKSSNIIDVNNNGKIINLSNLNNFSYATEKYKCYYENNRVTPNLNQNQNNNKEKTIVTNKNKSNIKINMNNYTTKKSNENKNLNKNFNNKKEINNNVNNSNNVNINPILFTKKYPKKENNKYPLRINYTNNNLNNALEAESLLENTENKEPEKEYTSRRDSKIITKINVYNSYNNDENKKKNKIIYDNNSSNYNKTEKSKIIGNNNNNINNNKKIYHTERISCNDVRNKSLNKKIKKIDNVINNINNNNINNSKINNTNNNNSNKDIDDMNKINIIFEGNKTDKREVKISNGVPRKYNLITIHDSLTFKPVKKDNNNNFIIKNNDRLMIINNGNHNKINSMGTKDIVEPKKERTYKISSNVVNEQFYKDNFSEKEISSSSDDDFLRMSMQSLNDSKIMEIANRYITDEENLDKKEVIEILNSKKEKL